MSLKVKLISCISLFMLMIGVLIIGVFAATQTINLKGTVNFDIDDTTLYVKDIRVQTESTGEPETIENFIPGYINQSVDLNLGTVSSSSGTVNVYFDFINTTSTAYTATATGGSDVVLSTSGIINGDAVSITNVPIYDGISGTIILTIKFTGGTSGDVSLDGIVITIEEVTIVEVSSSDPNLGTAEGGGIVEIGDEVTLTADFTGNADADFLGWRAGSVAGELVSTMPEYTFILGDNTPFTYYAVFTEPNTGITYDNSLSDPGETAIDAGTNMSPGGVFASALDNGFLQVPAMIYRDEEFIVSEIEGISIDGAFVNVTGSLTSLILPDSIESIGNFAFFYCSKITSLKLPSNLKTIGNYAFGNCSGLTSITIPEGVTSIGSSAFTVCENLNTIIFEEQEGWNCVSYQTGTAAVEISSTDLSNHSTAASYLNSTYSNYYWTRIIYNGVEFSIIDETSNVEVTVYNGYSTNVVIPSKVSKVGDYWVAGDSYIVTSIGDSAFENNSSLMSVIIPEGVTSIGNSAFRDCFALTSITIPSSVTSIGYRAFNGCGGLETITFNTPYSWQISSSSSFSSISATPTASQIQTNALTYLTNTYRNYYWRAVVE